MKRGHKGLSRPPPSPSVRPSVHPRVRPPVSPKSELAINLNWTRFVLLDSAAPVQLSAQCSTRLRKANLQ